MQMISIKELHASHTHKFYKSGLVKILVDVNHNIKWSNYLQTSITFCCTVSTEC